MASNTLDKQPDEKTMKCTVNRENRSAVCAADVSFTAHRVQKAIKVLLRKSIEHFRCMYYISGAISSLLTLRPHGHDRPQTLGCGFHFKILHSVFILLFSAVDNSYRDRVKLKRLCPRRRKISLIYHSI